MKTVLGLDLGSNSIGWALLQTCDEDSPERIVAIGARVFPEGVDRDTSGSERPKNQTRRIARGTRRQIARRARRRQVIRSAMIESGLFPNDATKQEQLLAMDPYQLRDAALERELTAFEIGRIFLHLAQRRGFLSNRKSDRGKEKETKGMLAEIESLEKDIGDHTLGQYLYSIRESDSRIRIRGRHTKRRMYEDEFNRIWEFQSTFHPKLLTDELRYGTKGESSYPRPPEPLKKRKSNSVLKRFGLHGILFFQRSMYWPASVIGKCELEPKEKRCHRADRVAQQFQLLQEVNNLIIYSETGDSRELTEEQRALVIERLETGKERTFDDLRKTLGLPATDT
ncbi:MAG: hypothetical protein MK102_19710, partial [Fuerstiella sp.]|nr:hypothetical protein [Fuerstiella sp.]